MKKNFVCCICFFLLTATNAWCTTPTISGTTGTPQNGQTITIQGANFLNENTANWFMTSSESHCDGSNPSADGWLQGGGATGKTYDSSVYLVDGKSMRFDISGNGGSDCPTDNKGDYVYRSPTAPVMYARAYIRYSSNAQTLFSTAYYAKMFYWMQAGVYVQPVVGGGWPSQMDVKIQANYDYLPLPKPWTGEKWYCVEAMANHNTNTVQVWVDGKSIGTYSGTFSQDPFSFSLGFINACPVPSGTYSMWADGIALSTQRIYPITMVEIGNNSNYSSATKVTQTLVHASENSIQVSADLSGLGSGPYYVWVTNNQQQRSAAFQLGSSGSGGGTTPPPAGDTTNPTISISSPTNGQTVTQSSITVSGTASDASGIKSVTVNGAGCSGTTSWSKAVSLNSGSNTITVVATDNSSNQNQTTSTIHVTYSAPGASQPPSSSQTLISENFEENNLNQFSDDINMGTFSIESSLIHGGSRALVNNLQANVHDTGWATSYFGDNPYKGGATQSDVSLQWYTYWSPGFQFPLGQKMFSLACFESWSAGYPGYQSYAPYYLSLAAINGQYFLQLESKTSGANVERNFYQNQGATVTARSGAWENLKVRAKLNTPGKSDGIVQMWVNGVLKLQYTDVNFRNSYTKYGWNMLMLTASASPVSTANQSMYWDDIALTSTGSGTDLLAPGNLRISSTN